MFFFNLIHFADGPVDDEFVHDVKLFYEVAPHFFYQNFKMHITNSFFQICVDCLRHEHNPQFYNEVCDQENEALRQKVIQKVGKECIANYGEELSISNCALPMAFEKAAIG